VAVSSFGSLGNGSVTNSISLSNGGRLNNTASGTVDLGLNRAIAIGSGGGVIAHSNAAAATINIPGNLTGSGSLSFASTLAGAGTYVLNGDNSGYTGAISVDAQAGGLTALRFGNQSSVPSSGSVTLNFPAAGATGNATTLDLLGGIILPSGFTVNLTSSLNGKHGWRSSSCRRCAKPTCSATR
jgi:hypothetical protein